MAFSSRPILDEGIEMHNKGAALRLPNSGDKGIAWNAVGPGWREKGKIKKSERRTETINQDLKNLEEIWIKVRGTRRRNAIYRYLIALDDVVRRWRCEQRPKTLVRHAQVFCDEKENPKAEMYSALIRATTNADVKTVSKLSRVLRFCQALNKHDEDLRSFIKREGGLNGCAAQFAQNFGRPRGKGNR
jgi:hypothetical protein